MAGEKTKALQGALLYSGGLSHVLVSVGGYIRIYLPVYGPEIIGGFGLEEKSQKAKAVLRATKNKLWRFAESATP